MAQPPRGIHWSKDGNSYYKAAGGKIIQYSLPGFTENVIADDAALTPAGGSAPLKVRNFFFSGDGKKLLIYTRIILFVVPMVICFLFSATKR